MACTRSRLRRFANTSVHLVLGPGLGPADLSRDASVNVRSTLRDMRHRFGQPMLLLFVRSYVDQRTSRLRLLTLSSEDLDDDARALREVDTVACPSPPAAGTERRRIGKPLFYEPPHAWGGKGANPQWQKVADRLGEWVHLKHPERHDRRHGAALAHQLGIFRRREIPLGCQQQHAFPERIVRAASILPQAVSGYHQ